MLGSPLNLTIDTECQLEIAKQYGISLIECQEEMNENSFPLGEYDVIIDAIFGIGLTRNIEGIYRSVEL